MRISPVRSVVREDYGGDSATATRDGTRIAFCELARRYLAGHLGPVQLRGSRRR